MQDDITRKLSLLVDDELPPDEAIVLLEQIYCDPELRLKWYQYQTIRQALQEGGGVYPHPDLLERVQVALATETVPEPIPERISPRSWNVNFFFTVPVALATAVTVLVWIVNKDDWMAKQVDPVPQMTANQTPPSTDSRSNQTSPHLEDYLLVHSEDSLYQVGPQNMMSYARIVSHGNH